MSEDANGGAIAAFVCSCISVLSAGAAYDKGAVGFCAALLTVALMFAALGAIVMAESKYG